MFVELDTENYGSKTIFNTDFIKCLIDDGNGKIVMDYCIENNDTDTFIVNHTWEEIKEMLKVV